jgi:PPIC-type PPIASE domain
VITRAVRAVLREPLVLFLAAGTGLFLAWTAKGDLAPTTSEQIRVGASTIQALAENWTRVRLRPPTAEELRGLVDDHVREEIYYREALARGLDRDDTIIRRRLRQKLEFLSADLGGQAQPSEDRLRQYLAEHPDLFRRETRLTWTHVFLSPRRAGAAGPDAVQRLLAALNGPGGDRAAQEAGDPFLLPFDFDAVTTADVARLFGDDFAAALAALEPRRWQGPIDSGYGAHLVLVRQRIPGRVPALEEVRDAVRREWQSKARQDANEAFYQKLRGRYRVVVEDAGGAPGGTAAASTR